MKRVLLSSALLLVSTLTFAQSKVSGTVKDANGDPLIGVSVMEVGTNNGAVTDINGNYTLNVKPGAKLKLSYIGFTSKIIKASGNSQIVLDEDNTALNEVVVVGYGTMRRKDVTSSITTVNAKDLNKGVYTDPAQMLQGKVPGLVVTSSGDPSGSTSMTLRGASSLRTGEAMQPYYVIDGIPGVDISMVAPDDIESIDVLRGLCYSYLWFQGCQWCDYDYHQERQEQSGACERILLWLCRFRPYFQDFGYGFCR